MNCDAELYARLTTAEKRLAALESALAAAERLAQTPASSMPDAIEQTEVEPPGWPVPQWRRMVDEAARTDAGMQRPLGHVLALLSRVDYGAEIEHSLARIVAVCEGQVGDGWKADPGRVPHGHWGIAWLLTPLSHEPPDWVVIADRAAAWLRSLCEDGAA